jgi:hypothetical protein
VVWPGFSSQEWIRGLVPGRCESTLDLVAWVAPAPGSTETRCQKGTSVSYRKRNGSTKGRHPRLAQLCTGSGSVWVPERVHLKALLEGLFTFNTPRWGIA